MKLQSNIQPHIQFPIDPGKLSLKDQENCSKPERIIEDENLEFDQYGNPVYIASIVLGKYLRKKQ